MRTGRELTGITNYSYNFPGFDEAAFLFQEGGVMLINRDDIALMLDGNDITCFDSPVGKNDCAFESRFDRFIFFCDNINTEVFFLRIKVIGDYAFERSKEEVVSDRGVFIGGFVGISEIEFIIVFHFFSEDGIAEGFFISNFGISCFI
jgi:hypothetical protein